MDPDAARDLVRAREDCGSDLMSARHRLGKLLLRHGLVYSDAAACKESCGQLSDTPRFGLDIVSN